MSNRASVSAVALLSLAVLVPLSVVGQYTPDWPSLNKRVSPQWYQDAKFGIFIHWGVYSVPAWSPVGDYAEWYWNSLESKGSAVQQFHNRVYGPNFKYQDFAGMFKAELFNATDWAELFRKAGARYVVPTSKHHEGFTIWPSAQSWNWNSVDIGPHRDLLGELMTAVRKSGLHAGLYFSLFEWYNSILNGPRPSDYVDQIMYPQLIDLINNYQPDVLWTDGDWMDNSTFWRSTEFLAYAYNDSPVKDTIAVNDRWGSDCSRKNGGFYTPEYSTEVFLNHKWELCMGIDIHSFGLNRATPAELYSTTQQLLLTLIRTVANNGNLLLDIGPRSDGTIPTLMQERLLEMGEWLDINGEAIYASKIWRVQQEGQIDNTTIRYTTDATGQIIYAFLLTWPGQQVLLRSPAPSLPAQSASVSMLGWATPLQFTSGSGGVTVTLPMLTPAHDLSHRYIWVLKLTGFK